MTTLSLSCIDDHQTYLDLPDTTTLDEWSALGRELYHSADKLTWAMGDWADFGDRQFGALKTFCEAHSLSYASVKEAAAVARSVPKHLRNDQLLFGHHFEVSCLPEKQQAKWLAKAEEEKWCPLELRKQIRDSQGEMSLISDGKPLTIPTRHLVQLSDFLLHQPGDFWTDTTKAYWRKELEPLVRFYQSTLQ